MIAPERALSYVHHGDADRSSRRQRRQHRRARKVEHALNELWIKSIDISTGLVNTNTLGMLLKLVTEKQLAVESFVTHEFSFDQILQAYDVFGNAAKHDALKVLIH
jgi:alcohol dehydrogenase